MTKNNLRYTTYIILLLTLCSITPVLSQNKTLTNPTSPEIQKAQAEIETNPADMEAHKAYIRIMGLNNPLLADQYKTWIEKYPANGSFPLAIGTYYYNAEMPQAKGFLLKAAAMEPKNAEIWFMLSMDAQRWGQEDLSAEYMRKAALANPSDPDYAFNYLRSFEDKGPDAYKQKVFDFVKQFPANERGAQALYWLGREATNLNDKIKYFEQLRALYPPQKFKWSASGMTELADAYLQTNPEKALALINGMGGEKNWNTRRQIAESFIKINKLQQDKNYQEAIIELDKVKLPKHNQIGDFIVFKKLSLQEGAGNIKAAYDTLALRFAKLPTDQLYTALELYGMKIGKDKEQIEKDIQAVRDSTAVPAYPFDLGLYTSDGKLNLKDLKGKVILLTFWFPGCGPCRKEFPHFQAVINEFKGKSVTFLGINIYPHQDAYVLPFIKSTQYSFIPLRGTEEFASKNYGVQGEPANFLIDQNGKIIFKDFNIDNTNHRTLELMISSLLERGQTSN